MIIVWVTNVQKIGFENFDLDHSFHILVESHVTTKEVGLSRRFFKFSSYSD